jgi:hypothetical protein
LDDVREFVGNEALAFVGPRAKLGGPEENVVSRCECPCLDGAIQRIRPRVRVDTNSGKALAESLFERLAH